MKIRYMWVVLIAVAFLDLKSQYNPNVAESEALGADTNLKEYISNNLLAPQYDYVLNRAKKDVAKIASEQYDYVLDRANKDVAKIASEQYDELRDRAKKDVAEITSQQYDYVRDRAEQDMAKITSKIKSGAAWAVGAVAVGAATYGLYRWATRRGLGGIARDSKEIDSKFTGLFNQIDKKYSDLKLKARLTDADKSLGKGLSILIKSKIDEWQRYMDVLKFKHDQLKKVIEPTTKQKERYSPEIPVLQWQKNVARKAITRNISDRPNRITNKAQNAGL